MRGVASGLVDGTSGLEKTNPTESHINITIDCRTCNIHFPLFPAFGRVSLEHFKYSVMKNNAQTTRKYTCNKQMTYSGWIYKRKEDKGENC